MLGSARDTPHCGSKLPPVLANKQMSGKDQIQTASSPKQLPPHPGARPPRSIAEKFIKAVEMRFAAQGLLTVCQGDFHPDVQELKLWEVEHAREQVRESPGEVFPIGVSVGKANTVS